MALVDSRSLASCSQTSLRITRTSTSSPSIVHHSHRSLCLPHISKEHLHHAELSSYLDGLQIDGVDVLNTLDSMAAVGLASADEDAGDDEEGSESPSSPPRSEENSPPIPRGPVEYKTPFHRWMKTLHRRAQHRPRSALASSRHRTLLSHDGSTARSRHSQHRRSSSGSSFGFVAAVKSASVSLASASAVTRPRRNTGRSQGHTRTERSSRASFTAARLSEDSGYGDRPVLPDPAATDRSMQRRRILEELINTEEGYIRDVRFLMNVYVTLLASLPTLQHGLRSSINRNLTEIIELHEELLGDLHRVVPDSEYSQTDAAFPPRTSAPVKGHRRWRSLDAVPEDKDTVSWLKEAPDLASEAQIAGDVAKVFSRKMDRFFIYEEYGAKYEMMIRDVASTHRTMPQWENYQRGLEVLASSLISFNAHGYRSRKSLTIGDLLVKPIQRICKYPLLFAELLKYTPVDDDPNSHMEVECALLRLREATAEINRATNDARMRETLQKTWILQDRLVFPNQRIDAASRNRIRSFGHVELCGALHVCWQTPEAVKGQYMVCLLYNDVLCLASAGKIEQIYTVEACINLSNAKVEDADNGRGLQCHTAPFSWKLVFECDSQLYEIIMTACTPREQDEWRERLDKPVTENQGSVHPNLYSSVTMDIKSLGTVFSKPGTVARRISIHRAITVGPKSGLCQVILKNTSVLKDATTAPLSPSINRSQSMLTTNFRVPILAPHRGERARLEALLSDVWTREVLPFPGMTNRSRSEQLVRSSASTMMRKLSVTSIASSLSKRSNSVASMTKFFADDDAGESTHEFRRMPTIRISRENRSMSDQEFRTPPESPTKSTLPRIADESDRRSSVSSASTPGLEMADMSRWERKESLTQERLSDTMQEDTVPLAASSRGPSNEESDRAGLLTPAVGSMKSSPCASVVHIVPVEELGRQKKKTKVTHKTPSKWGRVGGLNKDTMVQGIRSFFR